MAKAISVLMVLMLVSCVTIGVSTPQTPKQKLVKAKTTITVVNNAVADALRVRSITLSDAIKYRKSIESAKVLVRAYEILINTNDLTDEFKMWKTINDILLELIRYQMEMEGRDGRS